MPGQLEIVAAQVVELLLGEVLDADQLVAGVLGRVDQLVELEVDGLGLAALDVADEEEQEEADARGGQGEGCDPPLEPAIGAERPPSRA